jgi:hypothetical protein
MDGTVIILDNTGDTSYKQSSREFLSNPILTDFMKVILTTSDQMNNNIKVRNVSSFGGQSNRDISLRNYADAKTFNNLILEVPLDPPILLDGQTYFETDLEPFSEMDLLFYFDQEEIGNVLG